MDVFKAYLGCQCDSFHEAQKRNQERLARPFVTISREAGTGGITVSEKLIRLLGEQDKEATCSWAVFDKNLVEEVIAEHHLAKEVKKFMPEDKRSETQAYFEELFNLHPSDWSLFHKTAETILHLAQMGNVVMVGRGANVVTRKMPFGFHVRLIGSLPNRIKHIQDYYHLNHEQAAQFIQKEDRGRKDYLRKHFDKNIDDPLLYDAVINTDRVSYERAAHLIAGQILDIRSQIKGSE